MKKISIIVLCLLCFAFVSCSKSHADITDIWDGTIATEFSKGDGTNDSPFVIETGAQLALMAKEVNSGNFTDAHFVMENNIDLNGIEWTPIGNGEHPFSGSFDGNGKTISNLKITNPNKYFYETSFNNYEHGVSGMFGICETVELKNLIIDRASISVQNVWNFDSLYIGTLIGYIKAVDTSSLSNVKIIDSRILASTPEDAEMNSGVNSIRLGGVVGCIKADINVLQTHADVTINLQNGFQDANCIGGIAGYIDGGVVAEDISSYLDVQFPDMNENYAGCFGYMEIEDGDIQLTNIFSKIKTNKKSIEPTSYYGGPTYEINAIIGKANTHSGHVGQIELANLYGYVTPTDENSEVNENRYSLYSFEENANYNETNCLGSDVLPDNHGFNTKIWDISDKNNPFIK